MSDIKEISEILRDFNDKREWGKFHTPENLAKSVAIEAGELLECFQWSGEYNPEEVKEEIADVVIYCIMLADKINMDLSDEIIKKIKKNSEKYPVDKCKGSSTKYNRLGE